jgi:hypothetical protein
MEEAAESADRISPTSVKIIKYRIVSSLTSIWETELLNGPFQTLDGTDLHCSQLLPLDDDDGA